MIVFPNCKINLGLNIIGKRADGFHNIETVFLPVSFHDALEIIENPHQTELVVSGISVEADDNNSCVKAYQLLKNRFPQLPFVKIHLHKTIPLGAGLGGGSADAAFTLQVLNSKFNLNLSQQQLMEFALELGSDCPFFIINKPCFAIGRGENLSEIKIDLSDYKIHLVNPGIKINTAWAFSQVHPKISGKKISEIIQQSIETWKHDLVNDFEKIIFSTYPKLETIKNNLYAQGATYAAMSGSGSTVFGIFKKHKTIMEDNKNYFYKTIAGLTVPV